MNLKLEATYILGALAMGFSVFAIGVALTAMFGSADAIDKIMKLGGVIWMMLAVISYPLARRFMK